MLFSKLNYENIYLRNFDKELSKDTIKFIQDLCNIRPQNNIKIPNKINLYYYAKSIDDLKYKYIIKNNISNPNLEIIPIISSILLKKLPFNFLSEVFVDIYEYTFLSNIQNIKGINLYINDKTENLYTLWNQVKDFTKINYIFDYNSKELDEDIFSNILENVYKNYTKNVRNINTSNIPESDFFQKIIKNKQCIFNTNAISIDNLGNIYICKNSNTIIGSIKDLPNDIFAINILERNKAKEIVCNTCTNIICSGSCLIKDKFNFISCQNKRIINEMIENFYQRLDQFYITPLEI